MSDNLPAHNLCAHIAYDGTAYLGWQKTAMGPSIEAKIQAVLEQILQQPILLQAASRTDAGVHAEGQIINFCVHRGSVDLPQLQKSINALLPKDIVLLELQQKPLHFHPTLDAIGKEYQYNLCYGAILLPLQRSFVWHYPYLLDIHSMQKACDLFIGKNRFAALCNMRKELKKEDDVRTITSLMVEEIGIKSLRITVRGDHFLYKMVRNIVGTLVYIGRGKICAEALPQILSGRDRTQAGITAPAHGLILKQVFYAEE